MSVKKIVAVLASAAICSSVIAPAVSAEEFFFRGITLDVNGTSVVLTECEKSVTDLPTPEEFAEEGIAAITAIGSYAFSGKDQEGCDNIEVINVPDTVTTIGQYAFYNCDGLTTVNIGSGVTSIGQFAFAGCTSLTAINVAEGNTTYKSIDGALYSADGKTLIWVPEALTTFTIAAGTETIASYAFVGSDITSLIIPSSVTSIGTYAFYDSSVNFIYIPASVTSIGAYAIDPSVVLSGAVGSAADSYARKNGNTFNAISDSLFLYEVVDGNAYITGLTENFVGNLVIPDTIDGYTVVGIKSINEKNSIIELTIGAGVTEINFAGLAALTQLEKITINEANEVYKSIDGAVYSADGKTLYYVPAQVTSFVVADGTVKIASKAIANGFCKSITVPASVTEIGSYAFNYGSSVTVYGYTDYVRDYALRNGNKYVSLAVADVLGDVNGDGVIDSFDAYLILVYCAESDEDDTSGVTLATADTNKDGKITAYDALLILQYEVDYISGF